MKKLLFLLVFLSFYLFSMELIQFCSEKHPCQSVTIFEESLEKQIPFYQTTLENEAIYTGNLLLTEAELLANNKPEMVKKGLQKRLRHTKIELRELVRGFNRIKVNLQQIGGKDAKQSIQIFQDLINQKVKDQICLESALLLHDIKNIVSHHKAGTLDQILH